MKRSTKVENIIFEKNEFYPAFGYLHINVHLYLHAFWLLAAVYADSIAFSIA